MKHRGDLIITADNLAQYQALAEVSGSVYIQAEGASLPALEKQYPLIVPQSDAYEAWKKCQNGVLVRLMIPAEAARSNALGRKCRAEFADVIEVIGAEIGVSEHDSSVTYRAGERVHPDRWDECRWKECSGGIHHFLTQKEAEAW